MLKNRFAKFGDAVETRIMNCRSAPSGRCLRSGHKNSVKGKGAIKHKGVPTIIYHCTDAPFRLAPLATHPLSGDGQVKSGGDFPERPVAAKRTQYELISTHHSLPLSLLIHMKKYLLTVLSLFIICFIWHNSMADAPHSSRESIYVLHLIQHYLYMLPDVGHLTNGVLRKLAHLTEYAWLGIALYSAFRVFRISHGGKCTLVISFLVASVDECIQLFSPGRSAEFKDVLIDTTGAGLGILLVAVLTGIWNRFVLSR